MHVLISSETKFVCAEMNDVIEDITGLKCHYTWWRHQMETFSALLALCANSPVTGELPAQRPVTRSFDVFFDL